MFKAVFFVVFFCISSNGIRIGHNTDISDHPWQVAIFHLNALRCGGSLISPNWVLTSSRCLCYPLTRTLLPIREMYLVVGSTNLSQGVTYGVSTAITNNEWDSEQLNDIGLIGTTAAIVEDYATPVTLPDPAYWLELGTEVLVTGWGKMGPRGDYAEVLQEITVKVCNNTICQRGFYLNDSIINDNMFCAGVDYCQGDLGGPGVVDGVLVGVISQGADCYFTEKPGMFQLVASFREWIRYNTYV